MSKESLADIVEQIPEAVSKIEKAFGMKWNGESFDVLSYPDIPKSEVDSVDNAPGGITARRRKGKMDLDLATIREVHQIADMMGSETFSAHDCAYASYCFDALDVVKNSSLADKLQKNVLATYRTHLLSWFKEALIDRSNLIQVKGLGKVLTEFVQEVPIAVITDGTPDIGKFKADWSFLNSDRLAMAGRKVVKVVTDASMEAGLWEEGLPTDKQPLILDKRYKVWALPYSDWTYQNKRLLSQLGFSVDRQRRWWYVRELTPQIKQRFDVGGHSQETEMEPPDLDTLADWYFKEWLPNNVGRFKSLFEGYIREAGSTLQFNFKVNGKGLVGVTLKRGISKLSDAIEELRLRYTNRQGRETWLAVMSYVIKLFHTQGRAAMGIIDKMNDLEHSNGMFMEKFPANVKSWYVKFLNAKFGAPKVTQLARYIQDKDLKELIIFFANDVPDLIDHPDYRNVEKVKDVDPDEPDWLAMGYPYEKGKKKPKVTDWRVQEDLPSLREKGASDGSPIASKRIVREITNAMKDIEAALKWKDG